MVWRVLTSLTATSLLCVTLGCSSAPKLEPHGQAMIAVTADQTRIDASVQLLNEVVVQLPPIGTPGEQWILALNDERFLQPLAPLVRLPDGAAKMRFLAVRVGRRKMRFFVVPPGKEVVPTRECELTIEIQGPS